MTNIKSKWTIQEKKIHNFLKGNKIEHKMHPKLTGNPDILLTEANTAVFLHGCFWHKCPKCYKEPKSRKKYWLPKIEQNVTRDKKNMRVLKKNGYQIVKLWEHEIKGSWEQAIEKLRKNF